MIKNVEEPIADDISYVIGNSWTIICERDRNGYFPLSANNRRRNGHENLAFRWNRRDGHTAC